MATLKHIVWNPNKTNYGKSFSGLVSGIKVCEVGWYNPANPVNKVSFTVKKPYHADANDLFRAYAPIISGRNSWFATLEEAQEECRQCIQLIHDYFFI